MSEHRQISGWGRGPTALCRLEKPVSEAELTALVRAAGPETMIARGYGRSYGDAAQNPLGLTVLTEGLGVAIQLDPTAGVVRCAAGVSLGQVLARTLPHGWFLPVVPGTGSISIGGAVASDIHGWNHRHAGTFSRHVRALRVLLADGRTVGCGAGREPELFAATAGGMGLTGIILEAELSLRRLETTFMRTLTVPATGLDAIIDVLDRRAAGWDYSFARLDLKAGDPLRIRGVVTFGRHLGVTELPPALADAPLGFAFPTPRAVPFDVPAPLVGPILRTFNALRLRRYRAREGEAVVPLVPYFYPTDHVQGLTRLYGRRGFAQYQCVVPPATAAGALGRILAACATSSRVVSSAVLNRMGPGRGWLSFPMEGYMMAIELPASPGLRPLFAALDAEVIRAGGRVYLAKDSYLSADGLRAMYPELPRWQAARAAADPHGRFASALSRRLRLDAP